VKVTVLPAVETKNWKIKTINDHVHQVRDMFLEELDQMQFQPSSEELAKLDKAKLSAQKKKASNKKTNSKSQH